MMCIIYNIRYQTYGVSQTGNPKANCHARFSSRTCIALELLQSNNDYPGRDRAEEEPRRHPFKFWTENFELVLQWSVKRKLQKQAEQAHEMHRPCRQQFEVYLSLMEIAGPAVAQFCKEAQLWLILGLIPDRVAQFGCYSVRGEEIGAQWTMKWELQKHMLCIQHVDKAFWGVLDSHADCGTSSCAILQLSAIDGRLPDLVDLLFTSARKYLGERYDLQKFYCCSARLLIL